MIIFTYHGFRYEEDTESWPSTVAGEWWNMMSYERNTVDSLHSYSIWRIAQ